jgi:hypothetical protein
MLRLSPHPQPFSLGATVYTQVIDSGKVAAKSPLIPKMLLEINRLRIYPTLKLISRWANAEDKRFSRLPEIHQSN